MKKTACGRYISSFWQHLTSAWLNWYQSVPLFCILQQYEEDDLNGSADRTRKTCKAPGRSPMQTYQHSNFLQARWLSYCPAYSVEL